MNEKLQKFWAKCALTLSRQSGRNARVRITAAGVLAGLAILTAHPTFAQAVWAHQNGSVQSNGAITIKTLSGGSYNGHANVTGSVAKANQTAAVQPPTVLVRGRAKVYRANGAPCTYPSLNPADTEVDVYWENDKNKKMTCWSDYPYAGTWRVDGTTIPCFVGLNDSDVTKYCVVGGGVQASKDDPTTIGLYAGLPAHLSRYDSYGPPKHLILDLQDISSAEYWGCWNTDPKSIMDEWNGKYNTQGIRDMMVSNVNCASSTAPYTTPADYRSAAMLCFNKSTPVGQWFLPAPEQLNLIRKNLVLFSKSGMGPGYYWTSQLAPHTYSYYDSSYGFNMSSGAYGYFLRSNSLLPVRCMRNFN